MKEAKLKLNKIILWILFGLHLPAYTEQSVCNFQQSRQTCTRNWIGARRCSTVYYLTYQCCEGYGSDSCETPYCIAGLGACPNGGACESPNYCSCTDNYYSPDCEPCTRIANCDDGQYYCTTSTDQQCRRCQYTIGPTEIAYQLRAEGTLPNRLCTQLCSWRDDSKQCYPGRCADQFGDNNAGSPASCQCATGFSSPASDCMTVTRKPDITHCIATISYTTGQGVQEFYESTCVDETTLTKYINDDDINYVQVTWNTRFQGLDVSSWPFPYYVNDFKVGIASAGVRWYITRGGSRILNGRIDCNRGSSRINPNLALHDCNFGQAISFSWRHADIFEVIPESNAGGFLKISNYDNYSPVIETEFYTESHQEHYLSFTFDFEAPIHCSTISSCNQNMLEVGPPYTRQNSMRISWFGWSDLLSGIRHYDIEVYRLRPQGDHLGYASSAHLLFQTHDSLPNNFIPFTFPEIGVYVFLLTVVDVAGNFEHSRRFVLFDNTSQVEISDQEDNKISVLTAAENTTNTWITTLDEELTVEWKGHFFNEEHIMNGLLKPIDDHHILILDEYQELTGQPPMKRSSQGIPHINGTVRYQMSFDVDHDGGRSITNLNAGSLFEIQEYQDETHSMNIVREDGDSIRFWIRAWDVTNSTSTDSILVHVDCSPPEITLHGLNNNGETTLVVHSVTDFSELSFHFEVVDFHSGLREVYWELYDLADPEIVHGFGQLAASQVDCSTCTSTNCYMIPKDNECYDGEFILEPDESLFSTSSGSHDYDYKIKIVATNNAMLISTAELQITIDTTPPVSGSVYDSEVGHHDADFQSQSTVHASWEGFFDRESGIKIYKLLFDETCHSLDDFENNDAVITTINTFSRFDNLSPATYFTTVIAYNNAMESSVPVCSDGITIDVTPPTLKHIFIDNAFVKQGFIRSENDEVYFVDKERYLHTVDNHQSCIASGLPVLNQEDFPPFETQSRAYEQPHCETSFPLGQFIYLKDDTKIHMTWVGSDNESSPLSFEVCIGSTPNADDILSCSSSHGHQSFLTYHDNLVQQELFYISVAATNRAGIRTVKTIGPIVVKSTAPSTVSHLNVEIVSDDESEILSITWLMDNIYENIFEQEFIDTISFGIGADNCNITVLQFTQLRQEMYFYDTCQWNEPPNCFMISTDNLPFDLHFGVHYCTVLKMQGMTEYSSYTEGTFVYHYGVPTNRMVLEIEQQTNTQVIVDIDYQTERNTLNIYFDSFDEDFSTTQLQVAISEYSHISDGIDFITLENSQGVIVIDNLELEYFQKYYTLLKAVDVRTGHYSISVSDGFTVLPSEGAVINIELFDGLPCEALSDPQYISDDSYHIDDAQHPECGIDIDYQRSIISYNAFWTLPTERDAYIVHQNLDLYVELTDGSRARIYPTMEVGLQTTISLHDLTLEAGKTYFIVLTACHFAGCFEPVVSDGVIIIPEPPVPQAISTAFLNEEGIPIILEWNSFTDIYLENEDTITRYDVAVFVKHGDNTTDFIHDWVSLEFGNIERNNHLLRSEVELAHPIISTACIMLALRGYSANGLFATTSTELVGCESTNENAPIILDAHGTIGHNGHAQDVSFDPNNELWHEAEREFTPSTHIISAVWPSLRHSNFYWKILSSAGINRWAYFKHNDNLLYEDYHCSSEEVLACGETQNRFINVQNLSLVEGDRYFTCVYAPAVTLEHELWNEYLSSVSTCSNGIVPDTRSPIAGYVWIGPHYNHKRHQTDRTGLVIQWSGFQDAETYANTKYETGIRYYNISVGTEREGRDTVDSINVGISNYYHVTGLNLEDGRPYFATVTAIDYVEHATHVSSDAVFIDTTPAQSFENTMQSDATFLTTNQNIQFDWTNSFHDTESGIDRYSWCIGTQQFMCDVIQSTTEQSTRLSISLYESNAFYDGHHYYFTVQAINGAGLITTGEVMSFTVDSTAPVAGVAIETDETGEHVNYQKTRDTLRLQWTGFHDPHVPMKHYLLTVGSCYDCSDIIDNVYIGLKTDIVLQHLQLKDGTKYFASITACNMADLCITKTSDGVIVDVTPPHFVNINDGSNVFDSDYQFDRYTLSGSLEDAYDMGSGLRDMTIWCSVLTNGNIQNNITEPYVTHYNDGFLIRLTNPLPLGQQIYVHVMLCDNVGLCISKISDGFTLDDTAPVELTRVTVNHLGGSIVSNSQIWKGVVKAAWQVLDDESPIIQTKIALKAVQNSSEPFEKKLLYGKKSEYTFTGLFLNDGDTIVISVITCNAALLCTTSESLPTLIDNSPPATGAFAISSSHAVDDILQESRNASSFMAYSQIIHEQRNTVFNSETNQTEEVVTVPFQSAQIRIAWIGFVDPHSDIESYEIRIGRTYRGIELLQEPIIVDHTQLTPRLEGYLQTYSVMVLENIVHYEQLYITIQATNQVGFKSSVLHGLFEAIPVTGNSGMLHLIRRCDSNTCENHCTCAPHGLIHCSQEGAGCSDLTGNSAFGQVSVLDILPNTSYETQNYDLNFSISKDTLAAKWIVDNNGRQPLWFEYSVGIAGSHPGIGLLNSLTQPVWFDNMDSTNAIFTTSMSHLEDIVFEPYTIYEFYVRAWYTDSQFAIFKSDGIKIDFTPPETSTTFKVKEQLGSRQQDIDFSTSASNVVINWANVFRDSESSIDTFTLCISTIKGECDIVEQTFGSETLQASMSNTDLDINIEYITTVTCCNVAKLCTSAFSDGFKLDTSPPFGGYVHDGSGLFDISYSLSSNSIDIYWNGFYDDESYVKYYNACLLLQSEVNSHVYLSCIETNEQKATFSLQTDNYQGLTLLGGVTAFNGVGLQSDNILSNGVTVDRTPPNVTHMLETGNNLISNPSFEESLDSDVWNFGRDATSPIYTVSPFHGLQYICLNNNEIQQTILGISSGSFFRLSFAVKQQPSVLGLSSSFYVDTGNHHDSFMITGNEQFNNSFNENWRQFHIYITAYTDHILVKLGSAEKRILLCVDDITLYKLSEEISPNPIHVIVTSTAANSEIVATWNVNDFESPIVETLVGIGRVQGGIQISNFESVGMHTTYRKSGLKLSHGTHVFVTIKVTNAAALSSVFYSTPVVVDKTPPLINFFEVNNGSTFFSTESLSISWLSDDPESGIETCWITGNTEDNTEVLPSQTVSGNGSTVLQTSHLLSLNHGMRFKILLRCKNNVGLLSSMGTQYMSVISQAPRIDQATLNITHRPTTIFPERENYLSDNSQIWVTWDGFVDEVGIKNCKVDLSNITNQATTWVPVGFDSRRFLNLKNLNLFDGRSYEIQLFCENEGGFSSDIMRTSFRVETTTPQYSGESVHIEWLSNDTLHLEWTNCFNSNSDLTYYVHVGTVVGGADVLRWIDTSQTRIQINELSRGLEYYITIIAINMAGLYTSHTFLVI